MWFMSFPDGDSLGNAVVYVLLVLFTACRVTMSFHFGTQTCYLDLSFSGLQSHRAGGRLTVEVLLLVLILDSENG